MRGGVWGTKGPTGAGFDLGEVEGGMAAHCPGEFESDGDRVDDLQERANKPGG